MRGPVSPEETARLVALFSAGRTEAGSYAAGRSLSGFLYGVTPGDPATLGGVIVAVMLVALVACLLPGRRAATQDPVRALRGD